MKDWTAAISIDELKDILISEPPPLPKSIGQHSFETVQFKEPAISSNNSGYDLTYSKEIEATIFGVLLLVVPIALKMSGEIKFETEESYNLARIFISVGSIIIRIVVTFYVVSIASRQNRNTTGWGWFAFMLPSISLIIVGLLKKLRLNIEIDQNLPSANQANILFEKANQLYIDSRYNESIEVLNKAIELDGQNHDSIKLRALANFQLMKYDTSKSDFDALNEKGLFPSIVNYYLGNFAILDFKREKAITYWLKAKEHNNKHAETQLNHFYFFTGQYLLDSSHVEKKLGSNSTWKYQYFGNGKYIQGIKEIDQLKELNSLRTQLCGRDYGLEIVMTKTLKTHHIAIAFYEIDDIVFIEKENIIELYLTDESILTLSYDQSKDFSHGLKVLCEKFEKATGQTPSATSSWSDKNGS